MLSDDMPVAVLLNICDKVVFAEKLHVSALATGGWSTLDFCQRNHRDRKLNRALGFTDSFSMNVFYFPIHATGSWLIPQR